MAYSQEERDKIREEYETTSISFRDLAKKHKLEDKTLRIWGKKEGWKKLKPQIAAQITAQKKAYIDQVISTQSSKIKEVSEAELDLQRLQLKFLEKATLKNLTELDKIEQGDVNSLNKLIQANSTTIKDYRLMKGLDKEAKSKEDEDSGQQQKYIYEFVDVQKDANDP